MRNPTFLRKEGYRFLDEAQQIIDTALAETRALTTAEVAKVELLRAEAEPLLEQSSRILAALQTES